MSRGEYQRNTSILETYSEGWEKATLGLAGKLKPLQRHGRDDLSGCSLKAQQILSGGITLTNSLDLQSRTSRMWKLFIMDYWTLLRMVSLVHLEFFLTLPPSTETSRYISSLLAWESLNWHLSSSLSGGFWAHRMVTPIQVWIVPYFVSQNQSFPSWVPAFLMYSSPSNLPLWNLFFVLFENPSRLFTN